MIYFKERPREIATPKVMISFWLNGHFYFYEPAEKIVSPVVIGIIKNDRYLNRNVTIKQL